MIFLEPCIPLECLTAFTIKTIALKDKMVINISIY
jgi:hypothetical protein